jgi:Fic family protein
MQEEKEPLMISMTVHAPSDKLGDYQDKLVDLFRADAALNKTIPKSIRYSTEGLLRLVNCFYSNKIEGNSTHPKDFLRAQYENAGQANNKSKDIMELFAHLEAQIKLSVTDIKPGVICESQFIQELHRSFYELLPEECLIIKDIDGNNVIQKNGELLLLEPGNWRTQDVIVGQHKPPSYEEVNRYMDWVSSSFRLDRIHGTNKVLAAAAIHHRLAWVHPFLDGNGRVIRLLTDCYMKAAGFGGYGLWSIT